MNGEVAEKQMLLAHLDEIHTTAMGLDRIRKNLSLTKSDAVAWCKNQIASPRAEITRSGKNWYVAAGDCVITVNAYSYTIITAHKRKG